MIITVPDQSWQGESQPYKVNVISTNSPQLSFDWSLHRPSSLGEAKRHWHPQSEHYAGVDALFTGFDRGWRIIGVIYREEYHFSKTRHTIIYHFQLQRGDAVMWMPVISNPCLSWNLERWGVLVTAIRKYKPENKI